MIFLGVPSSLFMGAATVGIALEKPTVVECHRAPSAAVTCQVRRENPLAILRSQQTVYDPISARAEQVEVVHTNKTRSRRGRTSRHTFTTIEYQLTLRSYRSGEAMIITYRYEDQWDLLQIGEAQINAFLSSSSSVPLTLEFPREKIHAFAPGIFLVVLGGLFLVLPFYALGTTPTITLTFDKSQNRVTRKVESRGLQTTQRFRLSNIDTVTVQEKTRGKKLPVYRTVLELNNRKIVRTASPATPCRDDAEEIAKLIRQFLGHPV